MRFKALQRFEQVIHMGRVKNTIRPLGVYVGKKRCVQPLCRHGAVLGQVLHDLLDELQLAGAGRAFRTPGLCQQFGPVALQIAEVGWGGIDRVPRCASCIGSAWFSDQPLISSARPSPRMSSSNLPIEQRSGVLSASRMNEGLTLHTAAVCERVGPWRLRSAAKRAARSGSRAGVICIF